MCDDRNSLHSERTAGSNALPAIWICGRLLNQIRHQMQVLWLLGSESDGSDGATAYRLDAIPWHQLSLAVRGLVDQEERRTELQLIVESVRRDWEVKFGCEWHANWLLEINREVNDELIVTQTPSNIVRSRHCDLLLGTVTNLLAAIQSGISDCLGSHDSSLFSLACRTDSLLHPVPAYPAMTLPCNSDVAASELRIEGLAWQLPVLPVILGEPAECVAELRVRLTELGRAADEIENVFEACDSVGDFVSAVQRLILSHQLTPVVRAETDPELTSSVSEPIDCEQWESTPAGVDFDERRRLVRNPENGVQCELTRSLDFFVLRHIAQNGPRFTQRRELEDNWERWGGRTFGETAVDSRITAIRGIACELGFAIINERGVGWRVCPRET